MRFLEVYLACLSLHLPLGRTHELVHGIGVSWEDVSNTARELEFEQEYQFQLSIQNSHIKMRQNSQDVA